MNTYNLYSYYIYNTKGEGPLWIKAQKKKDCVKWVY